ncbi:MAG: cold shock domain-containing protein [Pararhodobacter sp.]|nr:cold shock domain-containing protein [Pararhodobacter sp.]
MVEMERCLPRMRGSVKWFDPGKGFGFIVSESGGPDILLHVNALRSYGQSTVCDGTTIVVSVQQTPRGLQAVEVVEIVPPVEAEGGDESGQALPAEYLTLPLEPARVKWFDKAKGFGFGNVFGRGEDIFIHMEALRRSGFADLQPGEAVALRIVDGERGRLAVMIAPWEAALREETTGPASG